MNTEFRQDNIPEVGKYYHFWDDGKVSPGRHYICRVEELIPKDNAKEIEVTIPDWDYDHKVDYSYQTDLLSHWKKEVEYCDWLYADDTDFFVRISVPRYDDDYLYAVRTKYGEWFTLDVQSSWQGGRLDVDGSIYERVKNDRSKGGWDKVEGDFTDNYPEANKENWRKE